MQINSANSLTAELAHSILPNSIQRQQQLLLTRMIIKKRGEGLEATAASL
jgi:hypothetical protein